MGFFTDGSSTTAGGAGVILTIPDGFKIQQAIKFHFNVKNNEAEYEALLAGLQLARHLEASVIEIFSDSQLVVKQILGEYKVVNNRMVAYMEIAQKLLQGFTSWTFNSIQRSVNHWADALSKLATISPGKNLSPVYIVDLEFPLINKTEVCLIQEPDDWRTPIIQYIQGNLADIDQKQQRSIAFKAINYCLENNQLFRRSLTEPLVKCVGKNEAEIAMIEVHSGICGEHIAGKNLALKLMRYGIFWPTMRFDCEEFTKKCKQC